MNFDRIARSYEVLERLAFGRGLERCRTALLPRLTPPRRALLIGEGDGRFLQDFLACFSDVEVDVVEPSRAMIGLAQRRVGSRSNVRFHPDSILEADLTGPYDLVVTHFVLDVFTPAEVDAIARRVRSIAPQGKWLISEFHVCKTSAFSRAASRACIAAMYAFFKLATGVEASEVPDFALVLEKHGFVRLLQHRSWGGFMVSELWTV